MNNYRSLLLELSNSLTTLDLEQLKFVCVDVIPAGEAQRITQGFELFSALERRNKLSDKNRDFLASKLIDINRNDLRSKLLGIQGNHYAEVQNPHVVPAPVEERWQFTVNELRSALPQEEREPQEQGEPILVPSSHSTHRSSSSTPAQEQCQPSQRSLTDSSDSSTSSAIVPQFQGYSDPISREPHQRPAPDSQLVPDHDPRQEASLSRSEFGLDRNGSYLDPKKYKLMKRLGSGGFAKVYLVEDRNTGRRMACKMCDLGENHREVQMKTTAFFKEVVVLMAVNHRYIVRFLHAEVVRDTLLMFLEYMEGGSVQNLLILKGPIQEPLVRKFTRQILTAVDYIHNLSLPGKGLVVHKDIKGANILLDKNQENVKLADFGICTVVDDVKTATGGFYTSENLNTFLWCSPERLNGEGYSRNTDIWSVACTVVEMLTTKPPFGNSDLDRHAKQNRIINIQIEPLPSSTCSDMARSFLKRCFCSKDVRPSARELLDTDPFVKDVQQ